MPAAATDLPHRAEPATGIIGKDAATADAEPLAPQETAPLTAAYVPETLALHSDTSHAA